MELTNTGRESEIKDEHSRLDSDTTCELTDTAFFVLTSIGELNFDDFLLFEVYILVVWEIGSELFWQK